MFALLIKFPACCVQAFVAVLKSGNLRKLTLPDPFHADWLEHLAACSMLTHLEFPWFGSVTTSHILRSLPHKLDELKLVFSEYNTHQNFPYGVLEAAAATVVVSGRQLFLVQFVFDILNLPDPPRVRFDCDLGMLDMVQRGAATPAARMDLLTLVVPRHTVCGVFEWKAKENHPGFGVEYEAEEMEVF